MRKTSPKMRLQLFEFLDVFAVFRYRKVNEQAREIIAGILLFEISDPRLELVTVTGCEVSYDRSVCNVFYTTEPDRYEDVAAAFQKASGRIRSLMAKQLSWRIAPELRFLLDKSVDEAERIASALERDAARNKVVAPTDSDVPADADIMADREAEAELAAHHDE